jgi:hypothetical protein
MISTINDIFQDQIKCYVNMFRILTIINHVYENLVEKLESQETYFTIISNKICEFTFLDIWV